MVAHVISHVWFWTDHNRKRKSKKHFKEGKWWTYGSIADLQRDYFWQFTVSQVRGAFKKALKIGVIIEGNTDWNKRKKDRTKWYALANEEEIQEMTKCKSNMFEERYY